MSLSALHARICQSVDGLFEHNDPSIVMELRDAVTQVKLLTVDSSLSNEEFLQKTGDDIQLLIQYLCIKNLCEQKALKTANNTQYNSFQGGTVQGADSESDRYRRLGHNYLKKYEDLKKQIFKGVFFVENFDD